MNDIPPRSNFVPHAKWLEDEPVGGQGVGVGFLLSMTLLAVALRVYGLHHQSLWVDEISTWRELRPEAGLVFWEQVRDSIQGPLHLSVLWPLVRSFDAEFILRVPAAVAGIITVVVFGVGAGNWLDQRSARIGTLLLAVSPFHVWYSQEARGYSFLLLFVLIMGLVFREMVLRGPTLGRSGLLALAGAGAVWSNMSGLFIWAALGVSLLVLAPPRSRRHWGLWIVAFGGGLIAILPWLLKASGIWAVGRLVPGADTGVALRSESTFSPLAVPYTIFTFFFGHSLGPSLRELHQADRLAVVKSHLPLLMGAALPLGLAVFYSLLKLRRRHVFLLIWIVVPLLVLVLLAMRNIKPWNPRYGMVVLPWLIMLVAYGLGNMPRSLGRLCTLGLVGLALWSLGGYYWNPAYAKEDVRAAAAFLQETNTDQVDILVPVVTSVFDFYYHGQAELLDTFQEKPLAKVADGYDFLERRLQDQDRLWIVESRTWFFDPQGVLPLALARQGHLRMARDFAGVRVYYWERVSSPERPHE